MTDAHQARTTIGQLVYRSLPPIDFKRLTADLDTALLGCGAGRLGLAFERDGLALIDIGGSRVGIALAVGLDPSGGAAVTVTVGHGPAADGEASLARRQVVLARLIAQRIAARFPPLETVWSETAEVVTANTFQRLREELMTRRAQQIEAQAERLRARRATRRRSVEPEDVARMFARFDAALDARRSSRFEPVVAGPAPGATLLEEPASPLLRLTAHLIDATLMVIALPIGAAMMVYSLSRGGDINTSARAMGIAGTSLGLLYASGSSTALRMLML